jgi:hypothetical protein
VSRGFLALAALLILAPPSDAKGVELEGTWYVLVHYKDDHAVNADEERWEDRVWVFSKDARRLRWTEYPIVVFDDETGRFERRQSGQYARMLHFWKPNAAQQADIRDGLKVNTRGSKTKTLRGSDAKGWASGQRSAAASASVVTYTEIWGIEGLPSKPVFSRSDVMGGGRTDSLEGITRYATTEVKDGGQRLLGSFERDGSRRGTFEMMRSAPVGSLEEKTLEQRQRDARRQGLENDPDPRVARSASVEQSLGAVGLAVSQSEFDTLSASAVRLAAQGVEPEAIEAALAQDLRGTLRGLAEPGARHADTARYRWPFEASEPSLLLSLEEGFDFSLPVGTRIVAAREGVVTRVVDGHGVDQPPAAWRANTVYVRHPDGSFAIYALLKAGIPVKPGQSVKAGAALGAVGPNAGPQPTKLRFAVLRLDAEVRSQPVAIRFAGPDPAGVVPEPGQAYGGR